MRRIRGKLTYANVMSTIAVFLLLGGGAAFAASKLAKNSVGTKQIKNGSVTTESRSRKERSPGPTSTWRSWERCRQLPMRPPRTAPQPPPRQAASRRLKPSIWLTHLMSPRLKVGAQISHHHW